MKKGEIIRTPLLKKEISEHKMNEKKQWKDGLFDCLSSGALHPSLWTAMCFPQALEMTLLSRMRMTWLAKAEPKEKRNSNKYKRMVVFFAIIIIFEAFVAPPIIQVQANGQGVPTISAGSILWREVVYSCLSIPMTIYSLLIIIRLRKAVREKYGIATGWLGDRFEDCCCAFWCHCCTIAQIERQTSDADADEEELVASCNIKMLTSRSAPSTATKNRESHVSIV